MTKKAYENMPCEHGFQPSGNVSVPASFIDKVRALEDAYKKYIDLLCEELNELTGMAFVHGWKSSRVEAGAEARFIIADKSSAVREALAKPEKREKCRWKYTSNFDFDASCGWRHDYLPASMQCPSCGRPIETEEGEG